MVTPKDIQNFKVQLEKEKELLQSELKSVGVDDGNPNHPTSWEAKSEIEVDTADENEVADKMEELEGNELILGQLDKQFVEVEAALERIEKGTYGTCEVCGETIEKKRLDAIPSARTCMAHMNQQVK